MRGGFVKSWRVIFLRRLLLAWLVSSALVFSASAQRLSPLAEKPDWSRLEAFQETITRDDFTRLLDTVYAPGGAAAGMIEVREHDAVILKTLTPPEKFTLRFAKDAGGGMRGDCTARQQAAVKRAGKQ